MPTLLFITPRTAQPPRGGRALLSALHAAALREVVGAHFSVHELDPAPPAGWRGAVAALRGYIDGVTPASEAAIAERVAAEAIDIVYLDGSNLGRLAHAIMRRRPATRVVTLFHNVEARFFLGALRQSKSLRAIGVLAANAAAERLAVRHSERRIVLNRRDGAGLAQLYGRGASDIVALAVADTRGNGGDPPRPFGQNYMLFVGGGFYANRAGIAWFAREVAPQSGLALCVIGRGLEDMRGELELHANVHLIGEVDDLSAWYRHARLVVAPIFDGSGMKTKVAEALMHGKAIAGTSEAFMGYEASGAVGWRCDTRADFLAAIAEAKARDEPAYDPHLRLLYEQHYSLEALKRALSAVVASGNEE